MPRSRSFMIIHKDWIINAGKKESFTINCRIFTALGKSGYRFKSGIKKNWSQKKMSRFSIREPNANRIICICQSFDATEINEYL